MTVIGDRPTEGAPDPKPAARIVDRKAFAEFWASEPRWCQVCNTSPYAMSIHHIVPRGQGGDDVRANFALLCGHGTAGCHGDVEHYRNGARSRLRERMTPEQLKYVIEKKSPAWLDRFYPLPCPDCGDPIINKGAHFEACSGIRRGARKEGAAPTAPESEQHHAPSANKE